MIKVRQQGVQGRGIDFIDDPERGFVHPVEPVHDLLIQWRQPGAAVHDHQKNVRRGECDLRLLTNEPEHVVGGGWIEPAGIDHLKATALVRALGINPVAGDARLVVDDGVPGPQNPVEQGRFPDVRSPDHGHERHTRRSQTGQERLMIRSCWGFSFHGKDDVAPFRFPSFACPEHSEGSRGVRGGRAPFPFLSSSTLVPDVLNRGSSQGRNPVSFLLSFVCHPRPDRGSSVFMDPGSLSCLS